jgi:hypothetical protein
MTKKGVHDSSKKNPAVGRSNQALVNWLTTDAKALNQCLITSHVAIL